MTTRKGLRTQKVEIEMYESGDLPWIHISIQDIEVDEAGNIVSATPKRRFIHRRFDQVFMESVNAVDPVTGLPLACTVAGISELIRQGVIVWMGEEFGTVKDEELNKAMFP